MEASLIIQTASEVFSPASGLAAPIQRKASGGFSPHGERSMKHFIAAMLLATTVAPSFADEAKRFAPDEIPAATYEIFSDETLVRYTVDHMGNNDYWGTFAGATGTLTIDPKNVAAAKLAVKIPVYQLQTTNRDLDAELYSSMFFDYIKFHEMSFVSTGIERTGPRTAKVTGDLTIRDVTRPLTLDVTFHGAGMSPFDGEEMYLGFDATGSVKRSEFGLGKWVPIVSDETRIFISAEFRKK
jgi:polyisoprenoid-binding protein YceI